MFQLIPKVRFREFTRKSNKLILAITLAVISMALSFASLYEMPTTNIMEYSVSTDNFYEKYVVDFHNVPVYVVYSQLVINSTFEKGNGILQLKIEDINGTIYKREFEYSPNKDITLFSLEGGDSISQISRIRVIINAYTYTKGEIFVMMCGTAQPYYYLSIIAIPLVILSIILFGVGMYESFVKIKEERERKRFYWK